MRAASSDAQELRRILQIYESASGQMINRDKFAVLFSPNTSLDDRQRVRQILNIQMEAKRMEAKSERYLGLPVSIGKSRKKAFEYIKKKMWVCIQGWKEKLLSKAGKEVLIKAVAQAIPTYAMSCFELTKGLCDELSSMVARWW